MSRNRRYFPSKKPYTITFRVKKGLPFVCSFYMKLLLGGIIARAQRDSKVIVNHFIFMGNHPHLFIVSKDSYDLTAFYGEIEKKVTDTLKALLGLKTLSLWDGSPVVAPVLDLDASISQISYLYANPARANLVESISEYPGISSYRDFLSAPETVTAFVERQEYWVPSSKVPRLPHALMKLHKDLDFTETLKERGIKHKLFLEPNRWMECFGVTSPEEVAEVNKRIFSEISEREAEHRERRALEKKGVLGEKALRLQSIVKPHTPAPSERKIFFVSSDKELRISFISHFRSLCERCRECFLLAMRGLLCDWPPGMFRPSLRHLASEWGD